MNKRMNLSAAGIILIFCICFTKNVFGGGFENVAIGSKAIGMGTAFSGLSDDATAIFYNPGGLLLNKKNTLVAEIYTYAIRIKNDYSEYALSDKSCETAINPGLFIAKRFDDLAIGFGAYVPYAGGGSRYDNFLGRGYDLEAAAGFVAFTHVLAYRLSPDVSAGVGLSVYMGKMERKENIVKSEYEGIAGYGGHVGFLYTPTKEFSIGLTARSKIPIKMDGKMKIAGSEYDSEVKFTFPYSFELGFGYKPHKNLCFSFDISYSLWGHMDEMTFTTEIAGTRNEITDYKNSWNIGAGVESWIFENLALRAGLVFLQGATEGNGLDPETNDVDQLTPNVGIAYRLTRSTEIDFNAVFINGLEKEYGEKTYDYQNLLFILGCRFTY